MTAQPATDHATGHRLTRPDAEVYYEVRGAGPLLLVVGQPMTSGPFAPVADALADQYTVVTYDPRGTGRSTVADKAVDVTPEAEADDLAAIIGALGGGPADVFGTSGGAVAGLALVARHPGAVRRLVAHEPTVTELLPDAVHVRAAVDGVRHTFLTAGPGAAWGGFVSLVMYDGLVGEGGVPPAAWPPPGAPAEDAGDHGASDEPADRPRQADEAADEAGDAGETGDAGEPGDPGDAHEASGAHEASDADEASDDAGGPAPDDELFFLHMLTPFTRWLPPVDTLRRHGGVVVAVGEASRGEVARRSAEALAERLEVTPVLFPGGHGGFMGDPSPFAEALRAVLADRA
jgi:pimeloyl-ACP methyl ester carboxylesterase